MHICINVYLCGHMCYCVHVYLPIYVCARVCLCASASLWVPGCVSVFLFLVSLWFWSLVPLTAQMSPGCCQTTPSHMPGNHTCRAPTPQHQFSSSSSKLPIISTSILQMRKLNHSNRSATCLWHSICRWQSCYWLWIFRLWSPRICCQRTNPRPWCKEKVKSPLQTWAIMSKCSHSCSHTPLPILGLLVSLSENSPYLPIVSVPCHMKLLSDLLRSTPNQTMLQPFSPGLPKWLESRNDKALCCKGPCSLYFLVCVFIVLNHSQKCSREVPGVHLKVCASAPLSYLPGLPVSLKWGVHRWVHWSVVCRETKQGDKQ